jgi:two-component system secretion system response regulator SalR
MLIVTGSASICYIQDLWDLKPEGLLARAKRPDEIVQIYRRVAEGERIYQGPALDDQVLTRCERNVLRLLAYGHGNRHIAAVLGVSSRTVSNTISEIKDKLSLHTHVQMAHFYLGNSLTPPALKISGHAGETFTFAG